MLLVFSFGLQRNVFAFGKQVGIAFAQLQQLMNEPQLAVRSITVLPKMMEKFFFVFISKALQGLSSFFVINGPSVVGINKTKIPQFATLVNIGHAGTSGFQQHLRKRIDDAVINDALLKRGEAFPEWFVFVKKRCRKVFGCVFIAVIGRCPVGMRLCFAQCFLQVLLQAIHKITFVFAGHWIVANQRLVNKILIVGIGCSRFL